MLRSNKIGALVAAALVSSGAFVLPAATAPASATAADPAGKYTGVTPTRIGDTRYGTGFAKAKLAANTPVELAVRGKAGVPATGVQAVVVNITAIGTTVGGWVTAYPSGMAVPTTSTLNFPAKWTGATTATIPVGADGKIKFVSGKGPLDLAVDVIGWYADAKSTVTPGALYRDADPDRWYDSRQPGEGTFAPGESMSFPIAYQETGGVRLTAIRMNLTALGGNRSGWFTAWNGSGAAPGTSSVNYAKGEVSANLTTIPVRRVSPGNYEFVIKNTSPATAHLLVDNVGYYLTDPGNIGLLFQQMAPTRIADTRYGLSMTKAPLGPLSTTNITVPAAVDSPQTAGFEGTITLAGPTKATWVTEWAADYDKPTTSNLNTAAKANRSNGFAGMLGCWNDTCTETGYSVYNEHGNVDLIQDVTGKFVFTPEVMAMTASKKSSGANKMSSAKKLFELGAPVRR